MAAVIVRKLEQWGQTGISKFRRVLAAVALSALFAANSNAATMTITGPSEVLEGDTFEVQIWGDFEADGLIAGGITFSWDAALVGVDSVTLNLNVDSDLSCPGSANCPSPAATSAPFVWGQFLSDLIASGAEQTLMATIPVTALAPGTATFSMADNLPLTGGWFGAGFADNGAPDFLDFSICIATISGDNDDDGVLDCADPDDDNDGIADIYDRQPFVASNQCDDPNTGDDRTLSGAIISGDRTCAAKESVVVDSATQVTTTGDLRVISKTVRFGGSSVRENGELEVINADPCPGCNPLPGYSDVQPIFLEKCAPCHTGLNLGGHNIGTDYADAFLPADSANCVGLIVAECSLVRILNGESPIGAGCTGDPVLDAGNALCLTQAEQDLVQAWIDGGLLE